MPGQFWFVLLPLTQVVSIPTLLPLLWQDLAPFLHPPQVVAEEQELPFGQFAVVFLPLLQVVKAPTPLAFVLQILAPLIHSPQTTPEQEKLPGQFWSVLLPLKHVVKTPVLPWLTQFWVPVMHLPHSVADEQEFLLGQLLITF